VGPAGGLPVIGTMPLKGSVAPQALPLPFFVLGYKVNEFSAPHSTP
jgi:hypothetical protein